MNREKEREYQENLAYLKEKFPQKEVELPLKLQGELLKQRALEEAKSQRKQPKIRWANAAAMACAFMLIAGIGIYGRMNRPSMADMEAGNTASVSMKAVPEMQMAAYSPAAETASESALGGRYDVTTIWKSWEDSQANYNIPPAHIHDFNSGEIGFTVITCYPDEGSMAQIVVIGGETDVAFDKETVIVTEIATENQLKFKALTLELMD